MKDVGTSYQPRCVAVLGAGVMGAQIAAHMANANVEVILFDLPAKEGDPNGVVQKAIAGMQKLEPTPFSVKSKAGYITQANYEQNLAQLKNCDLIIEAIAEKMEWKLDLYKKVGPFINDNAIFATNTSGLSIEQLSQGLPVAVQPRFCGIHFFNPPRYMTLVEIIPTTKSSSGMLNNLESFLVSTIGKGVVRAKDTPNFIANRVGVFSMLSTFHHAEKFELPFDVVDALTGPSIGRPKSATFRTADVVGLDTLSHVIATMAGTLQSDPWHKYYATPTWLQALIKQGAIGQKVGAGFYKKVGKDIHVVDLAKQDYRPSKQEVAPELEPILKMRNPAEKFAALRNSAHPQAQFLWSIFRDLFHYCAVQLEGIADNARDVDFAMRWGYAWAMGPFETWQAAGWSQVARWISEDIAAGKTMTNAPLPKWVLESSRTGVHAEHGSYAPAKNNYTERSRLSVYKKQPFPDKLLGENFKYGETVFETDAVRMWHMGDEIGILSFKSKMHAIGDDVLDGTQRAIREAEQNFKGLVLWQNEAPFSVGANLAQVTPFMQSQEFDKVEAIVKKFQDTTTMLKYSLVPTVAAVYGLALGGGCEFPMHCQKIVAALESYFGLVEVGVGLLPAGGGSKELAIRAAREAKGGNMFPFLQNYFQTIAMGMVSRSAEHAKELGHMRLTDRVVMNPFETLHVARTEARAMFEAGHRPPLRDRDFPVAGRGGVATLKMMLVNMLEGQFISEYDFEVGSRVATVLCGGDVENGTLVDENWIIELERKEFMTLARNPKTHARIKHMLEAGKPLRN